MGDFRRPIDAAYAFELAAVVPRRPPQGAVLDIREVVRQALTPESAERFERRVQRWTGPENLIGGVRPYATQQLQFAEWAWRERLGREDAELLLSGTVAVLRHPDGRADYVMRDHHMLDVALYHHVAIGTPPRGLFHADRHSDWCEDRYLSARVPDQAATWWALLGGLKRPGTERAWLPEEAVSFTTALAPTRAAGTRDIGAHVRLPWWVEPDSLGWEQALAREATREADWVSLDLDFFQPARQLALTAGLIRDPHFHALMHNAAVRIFVLSPQFIRGGDRLERWEAEGSIASSLRLLNLLRREPRGAR